MDSRLRGNDGDLQQARHGNDGNKREVRSGGLACQALTQAGAERKRRKIYAKVAKKHQTNSPLWRGAPQAGGGAKQARTTRWLALALTPLANLTVAAQQQGASPLNKKRPALAPSVI